MGNKPKKLVFVLILIGLLTRLTACVAPSTNPNDESADTVSDSEADTGTGAEFTAFRTPDPEGNCLELYTPNA